MLPSSKVLAETMPVARPFSEAYSVIDFTGRPSTSRPTAPLRVAMPEAIAVPCVGPSPLKSVAEWVLTMPIERIFSMFSGAWWAIMPVCHWARLMPSPMKRMTLVASFAAGSAAFAPNAQETKRQAAPAILRALSSFMA